MDKHKQSDAKFIQKQQHDKVVNDLITIMLSVKLNTTEALLNETTISDGKGGRIEL